MMIQIRKVRTFTPRGEDKEKRYDSPLENDVIAPSHAKLFAELDTYISQIPIKERWNLYYTLGYGPCEKKRIWRKQDVIPFDIDGIVTDGHGEFDKRYVDLAIKALKVDPTKTVVVASGHGIQLLVQTATVVDTAKWFEDNRLNYKLCLNLIQKEYEDAGLTWTPDPSAFAFNRLFRLPGTENRKPNKKSVQCRLLQSRLEPQDWSFESILEIPKVEEDKSLNKKQLARFNVDVSAVETGCKFLSWCKENQDEQTEPLWYAMCSVVARLKAKNETDDQARAKVHEYSKQFAGYSHSETERKIDQALAASGPRTCENIDSLWGECDGCPHYKQVTSPINIKGPDFIATEDTGFYMVGSRGALIPQYEDLRKYMRKEYNYAVEKTSGIIYLFNGTHYEVWNELAIRKFADEQFSPKPLERIVTEYLGWVRRAEHRGIDWFTTSTLNKINFSNGVLDTESGQFGAHSPELGFRYVLPFEYRKEDDAPLFDKFLGELLSDDENLQRLVLEYIGFCLCSPTYWLQKALLLVGEGANGKSTFLNLVKQLAGQENIAHLSLGDLHSETARINLEGKLINIADELPSYTFKNTEMLKKLMGGGMSARKLYHEAVMLENQCKFIFSCNDIPATSDVSKGLFRRLCIIPFKETFDLEKGEADPHIIKKLQPELPGIFNRVFTAYQDLVKRGYLHASATAEQELKVYKDSVDRVGWWIKENLHWNGSWGEGDKYVRVSDVYENYFSDCKRTEEKVVSKFHFTRHLRRQIDHWEERYIRLRIGSERPYVIRGATIKDDSTDSDGFTRDRF